MITVYLEGPDKSGKTTVYNVAKGRKDCRHVCIVDRGPISTAVYNVMFGRMTVEEAVLATKQAAEDMKRARNVIMFFKRDAALRAKHKDEYGYKLVDHQRLDLLFNTMLDVAKQEDVRTIIVNNCMCKQRLQYIGLYNLLYLNNEEEKRV